MRPKRLILLLALMFLAGCSQEPVPKERWLKDYLSASARAKKEHKILLLLFTGQDWCPACQHLEKTVLNHPDFLQATGKDAVRFLADFPHETVQEAALFQQNMALAKQFRIKSFPTMILLADGRELARHEGAFSSPAQFLNFFAFGKRKQR